MSSIASLHIVKQADLPAISASGPEDVFESLEQHGQKVEDGYRWSGTVLYILLEVLRQEHGTSLFSIEHRAEELHLRSDDIAIVIIGNEHKVLLPRLDPSKYDAEALRAEFAIWGVDFPEAGIAAIDGLTLLRDQIQGLPDDCLLVLCID